MKLKNLLLHSYQQAISEIYSDLSIGQCWPSGEVEVCHSTSNWKKKNNPRNSKEREFENYM